MSQWDKILQSSVETGLKQEQERRIEILIRILSAVFDKALAYTNVILIAGYVAFFTVWGNVKSLLSPTEMRLTALSVTISLLVFVAWEVTKMILSSRNLKGLLEVVNSTPQDFDSKLRRQQERERRFNIRFLRFWPVVLVFTILPALVGVIVLIWTFVRGLLFATPN